jgi:hypothetical protein
MVGETRRSAEAGGTLPHTVLIPHKNKETCEAGIHTTR